MAYSIRMILPLMVVLISVAFAQIPNIGRCPKYDPIPDFDRENFLGKWYEIARYFTVSEALSKCVVVDYERRQDGRIYANHENINRFTGVQRIVSALMSVTGKDDEATFVEKYQSITLNTESTIHVLGTDYDSYAVLWSCNSVAGPVGHTVSAWILARERIPDGPVLQAAYGVLDRFKISRTFFVNTDQADCETKGDAEEADDETPNSSYDIVVDDDTLADELFVNHYGTVPNSYDESNGYYRNVNGNVTVNSNATSTSLPTESAVNATNIKNE